MMRNPGKRLRWLFDGRDGPADRLVPRWIFLRALAAIYFSAFYSLLFQIKGLIGPEGILPAQQYLTSVARAMGRAKYWYAPSLFWISSSNTALMAVTWIGTGRGDGRLPESVAALEFSGLLCLLSVVCGGVE